MHLRDEGLTWQDLDGQVVVLDLRSSSYLELNSSASILFLQLSEGGSQESLVAALISAYRLDEDTADRDVRAFLEVMAQHDLLDG